MKVLNPVDLLGTLKEVQCPTKDICTSIRMLTKADGMGFSVNYTTVPRGEPRHWHYKNHLEACFCLNGLGILTSLKTGQQFQIHPGVLYVLNEHDNHTFQAIKDTTLLSIFSPALVGDETHDENGSYKKAQN